MIKLQSILLGVAVLSLGGCSGWQEKMARFQAEAAAEECGKAGYPASHPQHSECVQNTLVLWDRQGRQDAQESILGGLAVAGVVANEEARRSAVAQSSQPLSSVGRCPDGSYVLGPSCYRAPDGSYHAAPAQRAPDGSYVVGLPRRAPDGTYVGSQGRIILCPDGRYVAGEVCRITPSGSYVGGPS